MRALRLAISFVLVPRLFMSLFFFPLLIGLMVVYGQLITTGVVLKSITSRKDAHSIEERLRETREKNIARAILYGEGQPLESLQVCRWIQQETATGNRERPPEGCKTDRLDVALQVNDPLKFDTAPYEPILKGNVERIHVCQECKPDVRIDLRGTTPRVDVFSLQGMLIISLLQFNDSAHEKIVEAFKNYDEINTLIGDVRFHAPDFRAPLALTGIETSVALTLNIGALVVLALWLALKAHRKVLDYFARNGALLPMVAATGKNDFYMAIWLLTLIRVGAFLCFAVPITWYGLATFLKEEDMRAFIAGDVLEMLAWVLSILSSLSLATLIASVADLKHRHHFLSFLYRYIPIAICCAGGLLWMLSFFLDGEFFGWLRLSISALPLAGMGPVLLAPIFKPEVASLFIHALLTSALIATLLRRNARWFAAHLEEI